MLPKLIQDFVRQFSRLPGIGLKTSERLGFYIISQPEEFALLLSESIKKLKSEMKRCSVCGNIDDQDPCAICSDTGRDRHVLCIVENPVDIYYVESSHSFRGLYHVLGGVLSPLNGVTPKDLTIEQLLTRVKGDRDITELLFATSPTTEGDTTILYIKELLKEHPVKITHLARGIPVGTDLQYAGAGSLAQAIKGRDEIL